METYSSSGISGRSILQHIQPFWIVIKIWRVSDERSDVILSTHAFIIADKHRATIAVVYSFRTTLQCDFSLSFTTFFVLNLQKHFSCDLQFSLKILGTHLSFHANKNNDANFFSKIRRMKTKLNL